MDNIFSKAFHWLLVPANLMAAVQFALIAVISLIQFYKLIRGYLPTKVVEKGDKVAAFFDWAIPAAFMQVESLEKNGIISKSSKLGAFLDQLSLEAKKHGVELSLEDMLKAKAVAGVMASQQKILPGSAGLDALAREIDKTLAKTGNPPLPAPSK